MLGGTLIAPGDFAVDQYFTAGVYDVTGLLSTTANITITLDAGGVDSAFIFNVSNYLSFGAGTIIDVINGTENTSVVWNSHGAGGYTSIGANAQIIGTVFATTYASVGAGASATGSGASCGGVFSAISYVSLGANASVVGTDCTGAVNNISIANGVPLTQRMAWPLSQRQYPNLWQSGYSVQVLSA